MLDRPKIAGPSCTETIDADRCPDTKCIRGKTEIVSRVFVKEDGRTIQLKLYMVSFFTVNEIHLMLEHV